MPKSVSLHTLGCKLNYSETSTLASRFNQNGFEIKDYGDKSDIFVLNTCSVTENADKECRQIIRSILNNNPETYVVVTARSSRLQRCGHRAAHAVRDGRPGADRRRRRR